MKLKFDNKTYDEAKAFLRDATRIFESKGDVSDMRVWRTLDGALWIEVQSLLEFPEDSFSLQLCPTISRTIFYRNSYDGGDGWTYHPATVELFRLCPVCGTARGDAYPGTVVEDGEHYPVENWGNGCGHKDTYGDCWKEHKLIQSLKDAAALVDIKSRCPELRPGTMIQHPPQNFAPPTHSPMLVNAREMATAYPRTFDRPTDRQLEKIGLGSWVKICLHVNSHDVQGERFWVEIVGVNKQFITGICRNQLVTTTQIARGDLIRFNPDNIFEVSR